MQSISGIITQVHKSVGDIPPPMVGASMSVVGDELFVFAGRLADSRKMTNHMYVLDLATLVWTRHIPPPDSQKPPKSRYFHSACVYNRSIVVFGGMGYSRTTKEGLCVLDDVAIFDVDTMTWRIPEISPSLYAPQSRYAHLATIFDDAMVIVGGQHLNNNYLNDINIFNLKTLQWVHAKKFDKHAGAYRSAVISSPRGTRLPGRDTSSSIEGSFTSSVESHIADQESQEHDSGPIYLYSNSNCNNVKRELQVITHKTPNVDATMIDEILDCSSIMTGSAMPPLLRFPTGYGLGRHLIFAGTHFSQTNPSFAIWALSLENLTWAMVETGSVFTNGSWNRGVLYEGTNRFLVFGHRNRDLASDYNHRLVNFDHMAVVDLEAYGYYQLPKATCSAQAQELGLRILNDPSVSDFTVVTRDAHRISVNSSIMRHRWKYFSDILQEEENKVAQQSNKTVADGEEVNDPTPTSTAIIRKNNTILLPYTYPVVTSLLQYIYTDNLLTTQQFQPYILTQLLLLADMYHLPRLRDLSTHALHQSLNITTAPLIFETAALSHQTSLQIRALRVMIATKKMLQQQQQSPQPSSGPQQQQPPPHRDQSPQHTQPHVQTQSPYPSQSSPASAANTHGMAQQRVLSSPSETSSPADVSSMSSSVSPYPSTYSNVGISPQHSYHAMIDSPSRMSMYDPGLTQMAYRPRTPSFTARAPITGPLKSNYSSVVNSHAYNSTNRSGSSTHSSPTMTPQPVYSSTMAVESDYGSLSSHSSTGGPTSSQIPQSTPLHSSSQNQPPLHYSSQESGKKEKKKKKPFLEAFGTKLSMSFS